jgi:hypothetical protein
MTGAPVAGEPLYLTPFRTSLRVVWASVRECPLKRRLWRPSRCMMGLRRSASSADDSDVATTLRYMGAAVGVLALSACGGVQSVPLDVAYDGECVVEMEFERGTKQGVVDAFIRRVKRIERRRAHAVLSRADNLARFRQAVREEGHTGQDYGRFVARARRYAGRVLLVKADDDRHVFAIIGTLRGLPAGITSVAERESCPRMS